MNKPILYLSLFILQLQWLTPTFALGSESSETDLAKLSLEELLNINVSVAEVQGEEKITDTPAVVSRYEMKDMEKMGLRTLVEVLNFIPGVEIKRNLFGAYTVSVRGVYDILNQKVLFLLDGVPYYNYSHSMIPLLGIPVEGISHVEVIRGPGAVIYGTNASAGVINVVTKKNDQSRISLAVGDESYYNGGGFYSHNFGENKNIFMALEKNNGGNFNSFLDAGLSNRLTSGNVPMGNKAESFVGGLQWEETNFVISGLRVENFGVAIEANPINTAHFDEEALFGHLDHSLVFGENRLKFYFDYTKYFVGIKSAHSTAFSPGNDVSADFIDHNKDNRLRGGLTYQHFFENAFSMLVGTEYEKRSNSDYVLTIDRTDERVLGLVDAASIHETALFAQVDYRLDAWRFLLGARYNDHQYGGSNTTPRFSALYQLNSEQSIKFLYSQGFNSPNALQVNAHQTPSIAGNPNLRPETNETVDVAFSHATEETLFVANIYMLNLKDSIVRTNNPSGVSTLTYLNQGQFKRFGAEIDIQKALGLWKIFANLSYMHKANEVWNDDASNALSPRFISAIGVSYLWWDAHRLGLNFGQKSGRKIAAGTKQVSDDYVLDLNYEFNYQRYQLFATVKNLFDENIRDPEVGKTTGTFTSRPGRTFVVGAKAVF